MALFKAKKGKAESLASTQLHDGYAYFCYDDGTFHIDFVDDEGNLRRKQIAAIAVDVPSWAKEPNKPTYTAEEIEGLGDITIVQSINDTPPDENGNLSLDEILFVAFEEEGVIQPVYDDESVVFTDENGVMFVYDPVNQNVKVSGGKANITVNGVEPDAEGNILLPAVTVNDTKPDANGNIVVKFTVNGIEPDENGNIKLPVYRGAYEEE